MGNKLIQTSSEAIGWGVWGGPQSVSRETEPFLLLCLSFTLLLSPMFLGGVEEEGDVEVTHCNIIAMAMKSELSEGGVKGAEELESL